MSEEPVFVITLTLEETAEITAGLRVRTHEALYLRLARELSNGFDVRFTDAQLGELVRVMSLHASGGFPARLHRAFRRAFAEMLGDTAPA